MNPKFCQQIQQFPFLFPVYKNDSYKRVSEFAKILEYWYVVDLWKKLSQKREKKDSCRWNTRIVFFNNLHIWLSNECIKTWLVIVRRAHSQLIFFWTFFSISELLSKCKLIIRDFIFHVFNVRFLLMISVKWFNADANAHLIRGLCWFFEL